MNRLPYQLALRYCSGLHQRGVALLIVLWVLVLLSIVSGTLALLARAENLESRTLFDDARARMGALGGIQRAVFEMRNPDLESKWIPDGRPYTFPLGDAEVSVSITDETGKLDLNSAPESTKLSLLVGHGVEPTQAQAIVDAIEDWRDPDDFVRPAGGEEGEYAAAGLPWAPPNAAFSTVEELQQVLGMTYELYSQIEPAVTVFSGRGEINAAYAPAEALVSFEDVDAQTALDLISQRQEFDNTNQQPITLPNGAVAVAQGGGLTFSVVSTATLNNGAWSQVEGTFRLGTDLLGRPYRIVRWQEGVSE